MKFWICFLTLSLGALATDDSVGELLFSRQRAEASTRIEGRITEVTYGPGSSRGGLLIAPIVLTLAVGTCLGIPVARDMILAPGDCAEHFAGGAARGIEVESVSQNYPERDLALFTLKSGLPRSVPVADYGPCVEHVRIPAVAYFRAASVAPFLLEGGHLLGVRLPSGTYVRVASVCDWIRLKIGGD